VEVFQLGQMHRREPGSRPLGRRGFGSRCWSSRDLVWKHEGPHAGSGRGFRLVSGKTSRFRYCCQ
jgi:hypothetical protein